MKILSTFKDYYDYQIATYGLDEKIVFERISKEVSNFNTPKQTITKVPFTYEVFQQDKKLHKFHICGFSYDVLQIDGLFYMGEDLEAFDYYKGRRKELYYKAVYGIEYIDILLNFKNPQRFNLKPMKSFINDMLNEPIVLERTSTAYYINPKLEFFKFGSLFPSEDMWQKLVDWFSQEKIIPDNRDNTAKILSNGFDLKESFRGNK